MQMWSKFELCLSFHVHGEANNHSTTLLKCEAVQYVKGGGGGRIERKDGIWPLLVREKTL